MSTENMPMKKSNTGWIIAGVIIVIVIIVVGVVAYQQLMPSPSSSPSPTESPSSSPSSSATPSSSAQALSLYAGSVGSAQYGFGTTQSNIATPGPTLTLKVGQTYTLTLYNVGNMAHSWEIVPTNAVGTPMFGAGIDIDSFLAAGQSASVTFTPNQQGNFFYVCTVPGHIAAGMYGSVVVNP